MPIKSIKIYRNNKLSYKSSYFWAEEAGTERPSDTRFFKSQDKYGMMLSSVKAGIWIYGHLLLYSLVLLWKYFKITK